jgi:hypothetical protein
LIATCEGKCKLKCGGVSQLLAALTPEQRRELKKLLKE